MKHMEALKIAIDALTNISNGTQGFYGDWPQKAFDAKQALQGLVADANRLEKDGNAAIAEAQALMIRHGRITTSWIGTDYVKEVLCEHGAPTEAELADCYAKVAAAGVTSEEANDTLNEWLWENWKVKGM